MSWKEAGAWDHGFEENRCSRSLPLQNANNECRRVSILAAVYENRSDVELYQVLEKWMALCGSNDWSINSEDGVKTFSAKFTSGESFRHV